MRIQNKNGNKIVCCGTSSKQSESICLSDEDFIAAHSSQGQCRPTLRGTFINLAVRPMDRILLNMK